MVALLDFRIEKLFSQLLQFSLLDFGPFEALAAAHALLAFELDRRGILRRSRRLFLAHEEGDVRYVPDLAAVLVLVEFQVFKVILQRVAHHHLVVQNFLQLTRTNETYFLATYNWCYFRIGRSML